MTARYWQGNPGQPARLCHPALDQPLGQKQWLEPGQHGRPPGWEAMFGNIAGLSRSARRNSCSPTRVGWRVPGRYQLLRVRSEDRSGVMGISATVLSFGDLPVTTVDLPEGGQGTFRPNLANIGIAYSKEFSNSIYGGLLVRAISESIANIRSQGWPSMPASTT